MEKISCPNLDEINRISKNINNIIDDHVVLFSIPYTSEYLSSILNINIDKRYEDSILNHAIQQRLVFDFRSGWKLVEDKILKLLEDEEYFDYGSSLTIFVIIVNTLIVRSVNMLYDFSVIEKIVTACSKRYKQELILLKAENVDYQYEVFPDIAKRVFELIINLFKSDNIADDAKSILDKLYKLYECGVCFGTQPIVSLYYTVIVVKAYGYIKSGKNSLENKTENTKVNIEMATNLVRCLSKEWLHYLFTGSKEKKYEINLPYISNTTYENFVLDKVKLKQINLDGFIKLFESLASEHESIDVDEESVTEMLVELSKIKLFRDAMNMEIDEYAGTEHNDKILLPMSMDSTQVDEVLVSMINLLNKKNKLLEETNTALERANQKLKYANDSKGDLINEFNHKYKNMQYDDLKVLTNTLLTHPLKEVREQGRKAAIELFIKRTLRMDVILLMLKYEAVENSDNNEFINKFKRGIKNESTDNNLSIENIFYNCFNLVFMRFLYNGKKYYDMKNPVPCEEYYVYEAVLRHVGVSTGKSMEDFMLDFDNLVLGKNENIIEFLRKYNIEITTDFDWGNIFFDEDDYAEVLLNDMIIELITNVFKYADFNCKISFSMKKRVDKQTEKIYYCISTVNACRGLKNSSGNGIKSIKSVLDLLRKKDDVGVRIGIIPGDRWMSSFCIGENIFV